MGECTHDCSTCSEKCDNKITFEKPNEFSHIKKIIGVVSGKGGVGKTLVTSMLSVGMSNRGKQVAIIDADVTGPSIPKSFGLYGGIQGDETGMYPQETAKGIRIISSNLLLEKETDPIIWRGPVIAGMVKQFYTDVVWGDVDYMFVDMPPGTGDVPLTVFQSIKLDGIIIVTSPQELVSMIVEKAVNMANMMKIKIYGLIENMSYIECPDCGKKIEVFGKSKVDQVAKQFGLDVLAKLPIDPKVASLVDNGLVEEVNVDVMDNALNILEK